MFVSSDGEAARVVVHHRNVLQAAMECAVGHIVFLSGLDAALDSPFCYAFTNGDTERLLRATGAAYSITMFASIRQRRWEATSDAVADLTGRRPVALIGR